MGINLWIQVSAWTLIFAAAIALVLHGLEGWIRLAMLAVLFIIFFFILTVLSAGPRGRARAAVMEQKDSPSMVEDVVLGHMNFIPTDARRKED